MTLSLEIFVPSMGDHEEAITTWRDTMAKPWEIVIDSTTEGDRAGFLTKCQRFHQSTQADICGYLHADLFLHEKNWDERLLQEFADPTVAVAGFVGATRLGHPDIYKVPYDYTQLARADVWSNLSDAEAHGQRTTQPMDLAVIDSCAVFVRHDVLASLGGWPITTFPDNTHCTDLWLCLSVARLGLRTRLVPVRATHRSGGKGEAGIKWLNEHMGGDVNSHRQAHITLYNLFRDVLPLRVA